MPRRWSISESPLKSVSFASKAWLKASSTVLCSQWLWQNWLSSAEDHHRIKMGCRGTLLPWWYRRSIKGANTFSCTSSSNFASTQISQWFQKISWSRSCTFREAPECSLWGWHRSTIVLSPTVRTLPVVVQPCLTTFGISFRDSPS